MRSVMMHYIYIHVSFTLVFLYFIESDVTAGDAGVESDITAGDAGVECRLNVTLRTTATH